MEGNSERRIKKGSTRSANDAKVLAVVTPAGWRGATRVPTGQPLDEQATHVPGHA